MHNSDEHCSLDVLTHSLFFGGCQIKLRKKKVIMSSFGTMSRLRKKKR